MNRKRHTIQANCPGKWGYKTEAIIGTASAFILSTVLGASCVWYVGFGGGQDRQNTSIIRCYSYPTFTAGPRKGASRICKRLIGFAGITPSKWRSVFGF